MWLLAAALLQLPTPPSHVRMSGAFQRPRLRESSGVAASRAHPGLLWTHNDSGDGPFIYATDTAGANLGMLRVAGAEAVDWEDIALGPCPDSNESCLYLADTGDNNEVRATVTVYAVREPAPPEGPADTTRQTPTARALQITYPGGPADVEAIYVTADGAVHLVTKGRSRGVRLFRVAPLAWKEHGVAAAELVQQLPIAADQRVGRLVTSAAVSPNGAHVAVRTYSEIYIFTAGPDGRLAPDPVVCWLGLLEPQGEAVDYLDAATLVLTSEAPRGITGTIHIARCP